MYRDVPLGRKDYTDTHRQYERPMNQPTAEPGYRYERVPQRPQYQGKRGERKYEGAARYVGPRMTSPSPTRERRFAPVSGESSPRGRGTIRMNPQYARTKSRKPSTSTSTYTENDERNKGQRRNIYKKDSTTTSPDASLSETPPKEPEVAQLTDELPSSNESTIENTKVKKALKAEHNPFQRKEEKTNQQSVQIAPTSFLEDTEEEGIEEERNKKTIKKADTRTQDKNRNVKKLNKTVDEGASRVEMHDVQIPSCSKDAHKVPIVLQKKTKPSKIPAKTPSKPQISIQEVSKAVADAMDASFKRNPAHKHTTTTTVISVDPITGNPNIKITAKNTDTATETPVQTAEGLVVPKKEKQDTYGPVVNKQNVLKSSWRVDLTGDARNEERLHSFEGQLLTTPEIQEITKNRKIELLNYMQDAPTAVRCYGNSMARMTMHTNGLTAEEIKYIVASLNGTTFDTPGTSNGYHQHVYIPFPPRTEVQQINLNRVKARMERHEKGMSGEKRGEGGDEGGKEKEAPTTSNIKVNEVPQVVESNAKTAMVKKVKKDDAKRQEKNAEEEMVEDWELLIEDWQLDATIEMMPKTKDKDTGTHNNAEEERAGNANGTVDVEAEQGAGNLAQPQQNEIPPDNEEDEMRSNNAD